MFSAGKSLKILCSLFALVLGFGYLAAVANLYMAYEMADGTPGLSRRDVVITYYGERDKTLLGTMIQGPMRQYVENDQQLKTVLDWIAAGGKEEAFAPVKAILDNNCIGCHNSTGIASFRPLTSFKEVSKATERNTGKSWGQLARLSHQHFFGIGLLCFALGLCLLQTAVPPKYINFFVVVGFTGMILDLGGMWLTKLNPSCAFTIMVGGALTGIYFGFGIFAVWWDFFLGKNPERN